MIRLTERYYDTRIHCYHGRPLFVAEDSIDVISTANDGYDDYTLVKIKGCDPYIVLESAETVAKMCKSGEDKT